MDIFLVRHGEAASRWGESADPGLSERGHEQARAVANELQARLSPDTRLLTSPLARARETAQPLSELVAAPAEVATAFREIPAPVPLSRRQDWLREFMRQQWEGQADELLAWRAGIVSRLRELNSPAVVFTHFLVINAVVGWASQKPDTLCFWPDNGSITRLRRVGADLQLVELGEQMQTVVN